MKVVIAIDDSPYSREVIDKVSRRHWPADTEFKVLTVMEPISLEQLSSKKWEDVLARLSSNREHAAGQLCSMARDHLIAHIPTARVHYEVRAGKPKAEIVDAAAEWGADKIIVGAHGRGVCPRFLLGSVSRAIATHAPCSVEIVRTASVPRKSGKGTKVATAQS